MVEHDFVPSKDRLAAFVCPTEDQARNRDIKNGLAILATRARVVNLNNRTETQTALDEIAAIPVSEH
jgi:5-methylcytosine-specific restriction endonuclease McrBC regulatory subunit McrC